MRCQRSKLQSKDSVVSAKPFAEVVRAIDAQVGHPDIKQLSPTSCIHERMLDTMLAYGFMSLKFA
jgi:hypothetical protein